MNGTERIFQINIGYNANFDYFTSGVVKLSIS